MSLPNTACSRCLVAYRDTHYNCCKPMRYCQNCENEPDKSPLFAKNPAASYEALRTLLVRALPIVEVAGFLTNERHLADAIRLALITERTEEY